MANDFGLKSEPQPATPKASTNWPAWFYGPNEDEQRIFNGPEEVPDGWATSRANARALARRRADEAGAAQARMTRDEIIAELEARKVANFDFAAKDTGQLWQLLRDLRDRYGPVGGEKAVDNPAVAAAEATQGTPVSKVEAPPKDTFKRLPKENRDAAFASKAR